MADQLRITNLSPSPPTSRAAGEAPKPIPQSFTTVATIRRLAIPVLAVTIVGCSVALAMTDWDRWVAGAARQSTDDAVVNADVSTLSSQVSGTIRSTPIGDYQGVTKGQLLAQIDPREYDAAVEIAKANLASANTSLANLANQIELQKAVIEAAEAQNASALAQQTRTALEFHRQTSLGEATSQAAASAGAVGLPPGASCRQIDHCRDRSAESTVEGTRWARAAVARAGRRRTGNTALIHQGYTRIYAPFDGVLGRKLVHEGDFVAAGTSVNSEVPLPSVYVSVGFQDVTAEHPEPEPEVIYFRKSLPLAADSKV